MNASMNCAALHVVKVVVTSSSDALQRSVSRLLGRSAAVKPIPGIKTRGRIENSVLRSVWLADGGDGQVRSSGGADDSRTGIVTGDQGFLYD